MLRTLILAVVALGAFAPTAAAELNVTFEPVQGESALEDAPLRVATFASGRTVIKVRAGTGPCAAHPDADPGVVVADARPEDFDTVEATTTVPEPGSWLACAWSLDSVGAVTDAGSTVAAIEAPFGRAFAGFDGPGVGRGVPLGIDVFGESDASRLLQAALLPGGACPSVPAAVGADATWLTAPAGDPLRAREEGDLFSRSLTRFVPFTSPGSYAVCSWVVERPGDPSPEASDSDVVTVRAGRVKTRLGLKADRSLKGSSPLKWNATVVGAFSGKLILEARRATNVPRVRGVGRWRRVAAIDLAKLKVRRAAVLLTSGGRSYLATGPRKLRLPRKIGYECGSTPRIAFVRVRFGGSGFARPARSKAVELIGSINSC